MNPVAKQVISISPTGEISGLQRKPGQGLDLTKFGRASVQRATEVLWHERAQKWHVQLLCAPFEGQSLTEDLWTQVTNAPVPETRWAGCGSLLFADYDAAVQAEIRFLDAARLKGLLTSRSARSS